MKDKYLGDVENAFSVFQKDYVANDLNRKLHPFRTENIANSSENIQIKERLSLLQQQKVINESELALQKIDVNRFETLFNKDVVSAQDFENKKLGSLQAQKSYKGLLTSISQLKSALISNTNSSEGTRINGTKEEVVLGGNKIQAFYQLKKVLKE